MHFQIRYANGENCLQGLWENDVFKEGTLTPIQEIQEKHLSS